MSYGEPYAYVQAQFDWYVPLEQCLCAKMFPGFPDEGVRLRPDALSQGISGTDEVMHTVDHPPWEKFEFAEMMFNRDGDKGFGRLCFRLNYSPADKYTWYKMAMHTVISKAAYVMRPSVMEQYREYLVYEVQSRVVYGEFMYALANMLCVDWRTTVCRDIETQLLVWLTSYVDWHKQWVKDGCPINFSSDNKEA